MNQKDMIELAIGGALALTGIGLGYYFTKKSTPASSSTLPTTPPVTPPSTPPATAGFGGVADTRHYWQVWRTPQGGGQDRGTGWQWAGWLWANPCEAQRIKEMEDLCGWPIAIATQSGINYSKLDLSQECKGFAKGGY